MASPKTNIDLLQGIVQEVTPLGVFLTAICVGLVYIFYKRTASDKSDTRPDFREPLTPFPKCDMTLAELRQYDGRNEDGRVLLAVNGEIYDVSKGHRFYGPEGPYATLAGHDATRALATFAVDAVKEEWDDYSDLSVSQMNTVTEWVEQFKEKYDYVGRLVKTEAEKSTPVDAGDEEDDIDNLNTK